MPGVRGASRQRAIKLVEVWLKYLVKVSSLLDLCQVLLMNKVVQSERESRGCFKLAKPFSIPTRCILALGQESASIFDTKGSSATCSAFVVRFAQR